MISTASRILEASSNTERTWTAAWALAKPHADGPPAVYWLVPSYEKTSIGGIWTALDKFLSIMVCYGCKVCQALDAAGSKVGARLFGKLATALDSNGTDRPIRIHYYSSQNTPVCARSTCLQKLGYITRCCPHGLKSIVGLLIQVNPNLDLSGDPPKGILQSK